MPLTSRWSTWLICVLCFWMTDQMHDGKCNELLVREETIHGRGPVKAVYIPNLLPSLRFLRLVIFFALLLAVARAAVPQPPSLPNYHPHTDRQAADGETHCVHEEIQFSDETNVLYQGGDMWRSRRKRRRSRFKRSLELARTGSGRAWLSPAGCDFIKSHPSCIYLFISSIIYSFIYSVPQAPPPCFGCRFQTGSLPLPEIKNNKDQRCIFDIWRKALWVDTIIETFQDYSTMYC